MEDPICQRMMNGVTGLVSSQIGKVVIIIIIGVIMIIIISALRRPNKSGNDEWDALLWTARESWKCKSQKGKPVPTKLDKNGFEYPPALIYEFLVASFPTNFYQQ